MQKVLEFDIYEFPLQTLHSNISLFAFFNAVVFIYKVPVLFDTSMSAKRNKMWSIIDVS